jgi:hypothetical protein
VIAVAVVFLHRWRAYRAERDRQQRASAPSARP